jgi:very-short-patch-repair endonuclease
VRGQQTWLTYRSRALRDRQSCAEHKLWQRLRNRQLGGFKFTRQVPIGPYFADFVCRERMMIVEVDGGTHSSETELAKDAGRALRLRQLGYRVFRAHNAEIYDNIDGVLDSLLAELNRCP